MGRFGQAGCISVLNRGIAAAGFCGQLDLGLLSGRGEKGFRVESPFISFFSFRHSAGIAASANAVVLGVGLYL